MLFPRLPPRTLLITLDWGPAGQGGSSPPILPPSCSPRPPSAPQDQEATFPGLPTAARTTRHLTWVSWISSLCPPSRAWVLCARTRGCPSLCQVTAGSGSESISQLSTALSPAFTRTTPWGPLEACLKVGGTGEGDELSEGRGLPRVLPGPSRRLTAYGETRSRGGPRRRGWHRPRELEEEKPGQHAKGLLGDWEKPLALAGFSLPVGGDAMTTLLGSFLHRAGPS